MAMRVLEECEGGMTEEEEQRGNPGDSDTAKGPVCIPNTKQDGEELGELA